ncbi:glycosyltransferase family 9 protein [Nocardia transvalensis]|nr:glycosyltransferase family 9 protein [Nocardia transvalensis]
MQRAATGSPAQDAATGSPAQDAATGSPAQDAATGSPARPEAGRGHVLVARLDSAGDVLLVGPAVRAVAARADTVTFLAGPRGRAAAELLPGVDRVVEFHAAWVDFTPPRSIGESVDGLLAQVRDKVPDEAIIFTSFHQSPLPLALLLRLAGVDRISAISVDYPGSLLDVRHRVDDDIPEPERALSLSTAAGYPPVGYELAVRPELLPEVGELTGGPGYIVVHPGAAVPARRMSMERSRSVVAALARAGHRVVVTGGPDERELTAAVADSHARDLGGRTDLAGLAAILREARVVVAPNTGPAHLAAAVGTPVVSLFAPVVPARRWAPYGVPVVLLGDQHAPCAGSRARTCPIPGHPCLDAIPDAAVVEAVSRVPGQQPRVPIISEGDRR